MSGQGVARRRARCGQAARRGLSVGLAAVGLMFLCGCGISRTPKPAAIAKGRRGQLVPHPIRGQALSVLQMGSQSWLAAKKHHGVVVTMAGGNHVAESTVPSTAECAGVGVLRPNGSAPMVIGCSHVWVLRNQRWFLTRLPSPLVAPQDLTGIGSHWWLLGIDSAYSGLGNEAVTVWASTSSGTSWQRVAVSGTALTPPSLSGIPYYGDPTGIAVGPGQHVWLTDKVGGLGLFGFYRSSRGGTTWTSVHPIIPQSWTGALLIPNPPVFSSAHRGYLPITVDGGHFTGIAVYTRNGSNAPWTLGGAIPASAALTPGWVLAAAGPRTAWLALGQHLWISLDGGQAWRDAWRLPSGWTFAGLSFSGSQHGIVLASHKNGTSFSYSAWLTTNGGKTWANDP